jgi:hypothetical protein
MRKRANTHDGRYNRQRIYASADGAFGLVRRRSQSVALGAP